MTIRNSNFTLIVLYLTLLLIESNIRIGCYIKLHLMPLWRIIFFVTFLCLWGLPKKWLFQCGTRFKEVSAKKRLTVLHFTIWLLNSCESIDFLRPQNPSIELSQVFAQFRVGGFLSITSYKHNL